MAIKLHLKPYGKNEMISYLKSELRSIKAWKEYVDLDSNLTAAQMYEKLSDGRDAMESLGYGVVGLKYENNPSKVKTTNSVITKNPLIFAAANGIAMHGLYITTNVQPDNTYKVRARIPIQSSAQSFDWIYHLEYIEITIKGDED